jgi:hypothetical protein
LYSILLLLVVVNVYSQTAEDVIARHVKAAGGEAKLLSVKTVKIDGKLLLPGSGAEMKAQLLVKRDEKLKITATDPMSGASMTFGVMGDKAWEINPNHGAFAAAEMTAERAAPYRIFSYVDHFLTSRKKNGITVEYVKEEELEGRPCDVIRVSYKFNQDVLAYFDKETGLLRSFIGTFGMEGEFIDLEFVFDNYKEVDGILFAHSLLSREGYQGNLRDNMLFTYEEVVFNKEIDDGIFMMPVSDQ